MHVPFDFIAWMVYHRALIIGVCPSNSYLPFLEVDAGVCLGPRVYHRSL